MVNLKDYQVLGEFFPNAAKNKNSLSHCYGRVMKKLMHFEIVSRPEQKGYVIGVKAIRYDVNKSNLMDKLDYYDMSYPSTFKC